jgi:hypothetical protein
MSEYEADDIATLRAIARRRGIGWIAGELASLCDAAQEGAPDNLIGQWRLLALSFRYLAERKAGPIIVSQR